VNVVLPRTRNPGRKRPTAGRATSSVKRPKSSPATSSNGLVQAVGLPFSIAALLIGIALAYAVIQIHARYSFGLESPIVLHFRSPLVIVRKTQMPDAATAIFDQGGRPLSPYQQYTCAKFGPDCRIALAIQRAENPQGKCEIYHYNTDGTLDWGYFQINTVHLKRPGVNLRSLLDCKANIDFAYQLYRERQSFTPWSTYNSGAYKKFLRD
jgi:hypothetical protein